MSMTGQQAIDQTREIMNAAGSTQWSDPVLLTWVGVAHWREYANLLNINRFYKMNQVAVSQDANGQVAFSSLSTGSADAKKYFYRVITVSQPANAVAQQQFYYRQSSYDQYPNPQPNTSLPYVWYRFGDQMQVLPVSSGQGLTVTVNWRPQRADRLSGLSIAIDFPDGYEELLPWRAAWLALTKGGSEVQAAGDINDVAEGLKTTMLEDLGRESTWPTIARAFDDASDWGG